jgi:hypothetical protein
MENWTPLDDVLPVGELDPAIVELCRVINEFPGLWTRESCQGFVDGHRPGKPWEVYFQPTPSPPTPDGYTSLEFMAWLCCYTARDRGFDVSVELNAPPPYLNGPGECMYFIIKGRNRTQPSLRSSSARCGVGSFVCRLEMTMHNNHQMTKRSWFDGRRRRRIPMDVRLAAMASTSTATTAAPSVMCRLPPG